MTPVIPTAVAMEALGIVLDLEQMSELVAGSMPAVESPEEKTLVEEELLMPRFETLASSYLMKACYQMNTYYLVDMLWKNNLENC